MITSLGFILLLIYHPMASNTTIQTNRAIMSPSKKSSEHVRAETDPVFALISPTFFSTLPRPVIEQFELCGMDYNHGIARGKYRSLGLQALTMI